MGIQIAVDGGQSPADVLAGIGAILGDNRLLTLATVSSSSPQPHVNTCYYAEDESLSLYVMTPPGTLHGRNLADNPMCAANIFSSAHVVGSPISGLQLRCSASRLEIRKSRKAFALYTKKHPTFLEFARNLDVVANAFESRFYRIQIDGGKMIDEVRYGQERYLTFDVVR